MNKHDLLRAAGSLVANATPETQGLWARASAILARQALEEGVQDLLEPHAPGIGDASFTAQLLLLRTLHPDRKLTTSASYVWAALSSATHHHGYELPPTADALREWIAVVEAVVTAPNEIAKG